MTSHGHTQERVDRAREALDRAVQRLTDPECASLLGPRCRTLEALRDSLPERRLRVGIIGVTSSGKSALANALLGERLLPEDLTPTTGVGLLARRARARTAVLRAPDRSRPPIMLRGSDVTPGALDGPARGRGPEGPIELLELELPTTVLPEDWDLIDTPGLDVFGAPAHRELTLGRLLPTLDIVILTVSLRAPIGQAEIDVLARAVEYDQRLLVVLTQKDVERDEEEAGRLVRPREQKLAAQMQRIVDDVMRHGALADSGFAAIDSHAALAARARGDAALLERSGMPGLVSRLERLALDVRWDRQTQRLRRARHHARELRALALAMRRRAEGDYESAACGLPGMRERFARLASVESAAAAALDSIGVEDPFNSIRRRLADGLPNEPAFASAQAECDRLLAQTSAKLATELRGIRSLLAARLADLDLEAPREEILDSAPAIEDFPQARAVHSSHEVSRARATGWFDGARQVWWRVWPHALREARTERRYDPDSSARSLARRIISALQLLERFRTDAVTAMRQRFLMPLAAERSRLQSELALLEERSEVLGKVAPSMLEIVRALEELLDAVSQLPSPPAPPEAALPSIASIFGRPPERARRHPLGQVIDTFRDRRFHEAFLEAAAAVAPGVARPRLAILGLDSSDRWELVNRLLYRLRSPLPPAVDGALLRPPAERGTGAVPPSTTDAARPQGETVGLPWPGCEDRQVDSFFLREATIVVAPPDDSLAWRGRIEELSWADVWLVLVDGARVGSALARLFHAPYARALARAGAPVVYVVPHAAKLAADLPALVSRVLPRLMEDGPAGPKPCVIHEGYDVRYTDFLMAAGSCASGREASAWWRQRRLPVVEPFTLEFVEQQVDRVLAARREPGPRERSHG